ncbi:MAG: Ig-like domain-containing protein [Clostridia bacterium]
MKRRWMPMLALLLMLAFATGAQAAGNGETTYRALLVGVDGYQTNALTGCVNDTGRMSATLQAANEAGAFYQAPVIRSNLQTDEIVALFKELDTWNVDEDDVTFFYFAGHGFMSDKGTPAIVGKDSKMLKISDLIAMMDGVKGTKVVVLDCRYADSLLTKTDGSLLSELAAYDKAVLDVFKGAPTAADYYVMSASTLASDAGAAMGPGSADACGLVTYFLTQGCGYDYTEQRPTDDLPADANANGAVSLSEARDYVEQKVKALGGEKPVTYDVQIYPENSAYPVIARRATSEVLEVTLEEEGVSVPMGRTRQLQAVTQPANASMRSIFWSSADLSIATVDEEGVVSGIKPGTVRIAATTANGLTVSTDVEVRDVVLIETMNMNVGKLVVGQGATPKLTLTLTPADASEDVTWKSDNPTAVTVDQAGNLNCQTLGQSVVTAATESGAEASCVVQVIDKAKVVSAIMVNKKKLEMFTGESRAVSAKIKPANAEESKVVFTSSNPEIAKVDGESVIVGVSSGECSVYATASSGLSAEIDVTVKSASLKLSEQNMFMKKGKTVLLKTQIKPATVKSTITWSSSDPAIATVDAGKVTAVSSGLATITATIDGGVSATCQVLVDGVPVKKVRVKPQKLKLAVDATKELTVQVAPSNATVKELAWASSDEGVVQVDNKGVLTGIGEGRAIVTAKGIGGPGAKAKVLVTVVAPATGEVTLDEDEITLVAGLPGANQVTLSAETMSIAGGGSIKWASSNPKVAVVNKEGVVTAKKPGKVTIKAVGSGDKKGALCKITVVENRVQNKEPIVGSDPKVYTSARRIYYKGGYLVIELYFVNKGTGAVSVPETGILTLMLSDGRALTVKEVTEGDKPLKPGKMAVMGYKVKVAEGQELYGLDLRGAAAELLKVGEQPFQGVTQLGTEAGTPAVDPLEDDEPAEDVTD